MPPWLLKAAVQGVLSRMPDPQRWNRVFQRAHGGLELDEQFFETKILRSRRHVEILRRYRPDGPFTALELGTGWFPVAPIALALYGATRVHTVDLQDLLAHDRVVQTLRWFKQWGDTGRFRPGDRDRFASLDDLLARAPSLSPKGLLAEVGVTHHVADARSLSFKPGSIDLFVSNNTFEHIPGDVLGAILREFRRLAGPDSVMSHYVDMADHYSNFDGRIGVYNFLKFSDRTWRLFNNELQYQNRLRLPDYRVLHADAGWEVVDEELVAEPPAALDGMRIAPEFRHYTPDDLLVHKAWMVALPGL